MKRLGFTLMLLVVVLSPLAAVCQGARSPHLPLGAGTAPTQSQSHPLTPPDGQWRKIQKLPPGAVILVTNIYGAPLRCRFAAATDDALFCDAPESPGGSGWQFDRPAVISVEATILRKNHHPGLIAAAITGGLLVGFAATRGTDAAHAAGAGAIGAVAVAGAGAPVAFSQPDEDWVTVVYRPRVARQMAPAKHLP
jgi:hypothetical protein